MAHSLSAFLVGIARSSGCFRRRGDRLSTKPGVTLRRRLDGTPAQAFRARTEAARFMTWRHPIRGPHRFGRRYGLDALERYFA